MPLKTPEETVAWLDEQILEVKAGLEHYSIDDLEWHFRSGVCNGLNRARQSIIGPPDGENAFT